MAAAWPVRELAGAVRLYQQAAGGRVTIAWVVQGVDSAGVTWQLRGMNMLGQKNGKAFTNNQMGDPENGWQKVGATKA